MKRRDRGYWSRNRAGRVRLRLRPPRSRSSSARNRVRPHGGSAVFRRRVIPRSTHRHLGPSPPARRERRPRRGCRHARGQGSGRRQRGGSVPAERVVDQRSQLTSRALWPHRAPPTKTCPGRNEDSHERSNRKARALSTWRAFRQFFEVPCNPKRARSQRHSMACVGRPSRWHGVWGGPTRFPDHARDLSEGETLLIVLSA
jgi:hypothetical protein